MRATILGLLTLAAVSGVACAAAAATIANPRSIGLQPADVPGWDLAASWPIDAKEKSSTEYVPAAKLRRWGYAGGYHRSYEDSRGVLDGALSRAFTYTKLSGAKADLTHLCWALAHDRLNGGTFKRFRTQGVIGDATCAHQLVRQGQFLVAVSWRYRTAVGHLRSIGDAPASMEALLDLARKQQARMKAAFR